MDPSGACVHSQVERDVQAFDELIVSALALGSRSG
jgi:hypothetical protein